MAFAILTRQLIFSTNRDKAKIIKAQTDLGNNRLPKFEQPDDRFTRILPELEHLF